MTLWSVRDIENLPRHLFKVLLILGLLAALALAQAQAPERTLEGNVLTSQRDPAVRITVPAAAQYVGAERFVLYDIADCELHAFVEADENKNIQRLYWIQFEGYLASRPELRHTYASPRHAVLGGLDFYVDTYVRAQDEATTQGSDREHIEALIRAKGYRMPAGMMYTRFVHLLDKEKQKELMIVYGENLASTGPNTESLKEGGAAYGRWPAIQEGLVRRAETKIRIESLPGS